jgi:hypothetical protein
MMTDPEVKELIGKLNLSSDPVDQECAETLQQAIDGIESAIASGNVQPATGARARGAPTFDPEAAAMWRRMIDVLDKK